MSEPKLNDPVSEEPEYWRCGGCNDYFHPDKYEWHVDEECPSSMRVREGDSDE